jgi:hypothetical protein
MDVRFPTWSVLALASLAFGQQASQQKQAPTTEQQPAQQSQQQQKPAPLFGGQLGIRSARTTKESATLGFNGIDPSGKVDQKMLAAQVTPADEEKARNVGTPKPSAADLQAFVSEGGLKNK